MTAPLHQQRLRIDPVTVLIARAEARAALWKCCELHLHEAIDSLQIATKRDGLSIRSARDGVQRLLVKAFGGLRDD